MAPKRKKIPVRRVPVREDEDIGGVRRVPARAGEVETPVSVRGGGPRVRGGGCPRVRACGGSRVRAGGGPRVRAGGGRQVRGGARRGRSTGGGPPLTENNESDGMDVEDEEGLRLRGEVDADDAEDNDGYYGEDDAEDNDRYDGADDAEANDKTDDGDDGEDYLRMSIREYVPEEVCRDLVAVFGEEVRDIDKGKQNDENSADDIWDDDRIPDPLSSESDEDSEGRSLRRRLSYDSDELLALGKTFNTTEDFKRAVLMYSITRIRSTKVGSQGISQSQGSEAPRQEESQGGQGWGQSQYFGDLGSQGAQAWGQSQYHGDFGSQGPQDWGQSQYHGDLGSQGAQGWAPWFNCSS